MPPPVASHPQDRPLLALAIRVLAMVLLSTMFMLMKLAAHRGVSIPELVFWRQAMAVPLILIWLAGARKLATLRTRRTGNHALRAAVGTFGLCCNVAANTLLPLPEATTLSFTTPLFAVLITALVLRDTVGIWRWAAVVLGFLGVLVMAQPGSGPPVPTLGLVAGTGAGLVISIVSFQIRDLARTEAPIACVFYFALFGGLFTAVLLPFFGREHGPAEWALLAAIGLTGTLAQMLITTALRYGQVATVVVMDYTALIWATLYGWLVFEDLPDVTTWLGAPLIIGAGLVVVWREHRLSRTISPTSALDEAAIEEGGGSESQPNRA